MKITNNLPPVGPTDLTPAGRTTSGRPVKSAGTDKATLSEGGQLLAKAMNTLKETPDVRQERVEELHSQIISGQYQINYDELARRVTGRIFQSG